MEPEQQDEKQKEGEEGEEEETEESPEEEPEEEKPVDPFMTFPEPSHRAHTPAERVRTRHGVIEVSSFTEYNPYLGTINLRYPRKKRGAIPNSLYRRPPEIIPPPVDKWKLYKSEIGTWKPMSLATIGRKFDPAWKEPDSSESLESL